MKEKDDHKIREGFTKLLKNAGFKSINDFASKTYSHTLNKRSATGITHHFKNAPHDLRVLKTYARDLNVSLNEILKVFGLLEDYNFIEHLEALGFKRGEGLDMNSLTRDVLKIVLTTNKTGEFTGVVGYAYDVLTFALPFLPETKEMTELIIKKSVS